MTLITLLWHTHMCTYIQFLFDSKLNNYSRRYTREKIVVNKYFTVYKNLSPIINLNAR